jgi:hypothetical protein
LPEHERFGDAAVQSHRTVAVIVAQLTALLKYDLILLFRWRSISYQMLFGAGAKPLHSVAAHALDTTRHLQETSSPQLRVASPLVFLTRLFICARQAALVADGDAAAVAATAAAVVAAATPS